jgi:hypothetical protein
VSSTRRPGLGLWLRYTFTGSLPPKYAKWVLHDTTAPTWLLRHVARVIVIIAVPTALIVGLLPATIGVRLLTAFTTAACVVLLTAILANDMTERRTNKAGFPWGTAEETRSRRGVEEQMAANRRRRERIAQRQERRRSIR